MDDSVPLNRSEQMILDFIEKHPGCDFKEVIAYMQSQNIFWRDWYPRDYLSLERKNLIRRVCTPYPNPTVPELNLGTITLFPEFPIVNTDEKNEPLSEDVRDVLAFIRDNPGLQVFELMKGIKLDETSFILAFRLLRAHELILEKFVPYPNPKDPNVVPGYGTIYAK